MSKIDVDALKCAARGRWQEILTRLGGIAPELLDGRHHPCPKCGGKDRFRLIDEQAGAVLCNQCFAHGNGDGISSLQWLTGLDFKATVARLAEFLGMSNGTAGDGKSTKSNSFADQVEWCSPAVFDALVGAWCQRKAGVKAEAVKAFSPRPCRWPKGAQAFRCLAFGGRDTGGKCRAVLLYNVDGDFPAFGSLMERKSHGCNLHSAPPRIAHFAYSDA